jgi:glutamate--cysteine ligase catalytic subunit
MDDLLATHFAHLFIRDPIVVFAEDLQELDLTKADHFENLQSTRVRERCPQAQRSSHFCLAIYNFAPSTTPFEPVGFSNR